MKQLKVFTAFSGYDSQCMALDRIGIDYDLVGWSEIDKYAIIAHNAVYPQYSNRNYGDICNIDWQNTPNFDLFTYSSPCQDFSAAGLQRGGEKDSGTRSSLLWECEKAISIKRPKYLLFENVPALVGKKFIKLFQQWQKILEGYGYTNFTQVLNAKDYGVPQNRKRVFMVSILNYDGIYHFPQPFQSNKTLKDIMEDNATEEFTLSQKLIDGFLLHNEKHIAKGTGFLFKPKTPNDIACTLRANASLAPTDNTIRIWDGKYDIRRLTTKESFRLMGVADSDADKIINSVSKSQCYKLAGNSIVVDVMAYIFKNLFKEEYNLN